MIDIRVFPTSGRTLDSSDSSVDIGTNLITEYNIATLTNNLVNQDGFVVSTDSSANPFIFNLKGYFFELNGIPSNNQSQSGTYVVVDNTNNVVTATIKLKDGNFKSFNQLVKVGSADWSALDDSHSFSLILLDNNKIPLSSRIHFNTFLDDGDLDS